jgi:hypothetical protein
MWEPFGLFNRRGGVDPEYSAIRMSFEFRQESTQGGRPVRLRQIDEGREPMIYQAGKR